MASLKDKLASSRSVGGKLVRRGGGPVAVETAKITEADRARKSLKILPIKDRPGWSNVTLR